MMSVEDAALLGPNPFVIILFFFFFFFRVDSEPDIRGSSSSGGGQIGGSRAAAIYSSSVPIGINNNPRGWTLPGQNPPAMPNREFDEDEDIVSVVNAAAVYDIIMPNNAVSFAVARINNIMSFVMTSEYHCALCLIKEDCILLTMRRCRN